MAQTEPPTFRELSARTLPPYIRTSYFPEEHKLDHAAVGMVTEVGELMGWIKRVRYYNEPVTPELIMQMLLEMGDLDWYREEALRWFEENFNITESDIRTAVILKLQKRYPDKFSESDALNRDYSVEELAVFQTAIMDKIKAACDLLQPRLDRE